jgi:hypothetical protein
VKSPRCCVRSWLLTASLCAYPSLASPTGGPSSETEDKAPVADVQTTVAIPGPLRSFQRMAAISQKVSPEEIVPLLARNVVIEGYRGNSQNKAGTPTEFLVLLKRYMDQARELVAFAGPQGVIRLADCEAAKPLLPILGYRLRQDCGGDVAVEPADPERAFVTDDSGFPLAQLEETLRGKKPFVYPFPASPVPFIFTPGDWNLPGRNDKNGRKDDVVDALIRDPILARLYWALSRMDDETRNALRESPGLHKLVPFAAGLDFYGSHICIRSGRVLVPGGTAAEPAWKDLVGVGVDSPAEFVTRLLARDEGWLAAYFDALSRINQEQQAYFTDPRRLQRFYVALRGRDPNPSPTRPVFRPDPDLLLLLTRLHLDANGQPHVPGNLEAWKHILHRKSDSRTVREWARRTGHINTPEQLLEAMFAFTRVGGKDGPLQVYLTLCEIDRGRSSEPPLSPQTVVLLADKYSRFSDQYLIFSEFHDLNDDSITRFLSVAQAVDGIPNRLVRANALGTLQANVGLWQIFARQGRIVTANLNNSWQQVIGSFAGIASPSQVFDAGRSSWHELLRAASSNSHLSQDEIIALLAGPDHLTAEGQQMRRELASRMRSVMEDQRLVSLDTILALGNGLDEMAEGKPSNDGLVGLAAELREFEMPRPLFTNTERTEWASGAYSNRHTSVQMRTDLTKVFKSPPSPRQLVEARGQLAPFLRDTLVGLNYAYYEPPGAQMLHNNPLFVRSHDFSGEMTMEREQSWQTPHLFGSGLTAGGGAHLAGSLADLPYVLAEVEQNFIVPENVQALIWEDLVPGLLTSAALPRWWEITPNELHAVTLYQRAGEELLQAAAENEKLLPSVVSILSDRMLPQRLALVEKSLRAHQLQNVLPDMMPADTFYLAAEFLRRSPSESAYWGPAGRELATLSQQHPAEVSWQRLSQDFGVPHPVLAQSYGRQLLNLKPFPAFMGYASRLLAESWDSNNLYWARLADEQGYSPPTLNRLVPQLTRRMVEKIFATDFEDWPAMLRAMRETGDEFRQGKFAWAGGRVVAER